MISARELSNWLAQNKGKTISFQNDGRHFYLAASEIGPYFDLGDLSFCGVCGENVTEPHEHPENELAMIL